jgi:hypothetical protein
VSFHPRLGVSGVRKRQMEAEYPSTYLSDRKEPSYNIVDAIRLTLMVQKALDGLSKEPRINATMVAEKAMVDTFRNANGGRGVIPPFADGGVHRHVRRFAELLLKAHYDPCCEEFMEQRLPDEEAELHAERLEIEGEDMRKRGEALRELGSKMP